MATDKGQTAELSQVEKAAILLLCMDQQATQELFGQMEDHEIQKLGSALLKIDKIPTMRVQAVMDEFAKGVVGARPAQRDAPDTALIPIDGRSVAERLLSKSLGRGRGQDIIAALGAPSMAKSKSAKDGDVDLGALVNGLSVDELYRYVGQEHPQVVALVLAYVRRKVAKEMLEKYPDDLQLEILARMARLERIAKDVVNDLSTYIAGLIEERTRQVAERAKSGAPVIEEEVQVEASSDLEITGIEHTLKLLKSLQRDKSAKLVESLEKIDPAIGAVIARRMFVVEDLVRSDDAGIRELLRGVNNEDLKVSLKNTPDDVKEKFFKNMSERAAMILREDMEVLPALKVEDIEAAQEKVLAVAKVLMKEDKMHLAAVPDED